MIKKLADALRCIIALSGILIYVIAYIIFEKTIVEWWIPVTVTVIGIVITIPIMRNYWKWLTKTTDHTMNILCHLYMMGAITAGGLLIGNYYMAGDDEYIEEVHIDKKEIVQHDKIQKTGRRHYRKTGITYEYYLHVVFNNNTHKAIPVSKKVYNRTKQGAKAELCIKRGCFGLPVVTNVVTYRIQQKE